MKQTLKIEEILKIEQITFVILLIESRYFFGTPCTLHEREAAASSAAPCLIPLSTLVSLYISLSSQSVSVVL